MEGVSPDGELATLQDYLRNYRLTLLMKREELDPEQLARRIEEYARHCGHADLLRERIDPRRLRRGSVLGGSQLPLAKPPVLPRGVPGRPSGDRRRRADLRHSVSPGQGDRRSRLSPRVSADDFGRRAGAPARIL
jgi:hypothetical protein